MKGGQMGTDPAHPRPQKLSLSNWTWFSSERIIVARPLLLTTRLSTALSPWESPLPSRDLQIGFPLHPRVELLADDVILRPRLHSTRDVLGLVVGPRPAFSVAGAWLYADGRPIVHLSPDSPVRPDGAYHQWRRVPPGE